MTKKLNEALFKLNELEAEESLAIENKLTPKYSVWLGWGDEPENSIKTLLEVRLLDQELDDIHSQIEMGKELGEFDNEWMRKIMSARKFKGMRLAQLIGWASASTYSIRRQLKKAGKEESLVVSIKLTALTQDVLDLKNQIESLKKKMAKINERMSRTYPVDTELLQKKLKAESEKRHKLHSDLDYLADQLNVSMVRDRSGDAASEA